MNTRLSMLIAAGGLLMLGACSRERGTREIDWAKAALARNPTYQIVATDEAAGVFTVHDTVTGATETLRVQDLIAGPKPVAEAKPALAAAAPPAAPVENPAVADDSASAAVGQTTVVADAAAAAGPALAEGPGYRITRGEATKTHAAVNPVEGPGYSIAPQNSPVHSSAPEAEAVASNVERRTDPIICQGDRLMRIDDETIDFTGDAVIAEKGCDLYISNARIRAGGVGIIARQARVHIVNSTIGGTRGSYEASEGAEIYVARSTFTGVGRRFDSASMNDLGGNNYQAH